MIAPHHRSTLSFTPKDPTAKREALLRLAGIIPHEGHAPVPSPRFLQEEESATAEHAGR